MSNHRDNRRRKLPVVERLEHWQLLSSSFVGGIWTITGTPGPDTITVDRDPKNPAQLRAFEDGRLIDTRAASAVQRIRLEGRGGNDTLEIDESHGSIPIPAVLSGGPGRNLLIGGSGPTVLDGGSGKESLLQPGTGPTTMRRGVAADAARPFGSLRAFRQFLSRSAGTLGRTGIGLRGQGSGPVSAPTSPAPPGTTSPVSAPTTPTPPGSTAGGTHSTTNVQVPGVDEGDIVETDGSSLYILSRGELVVVDARQPDALAVASRTTIEGVPLAEYLDGNRLTVLSSIWPPLVAPPVGQSGAPVAIAPIWVRGPGQVKVTTFDVTDPARPQVVQATKLDGSYADSRMVDGRLYLVLESDLLSGLWESPVALARSKAGAGKGQDKMRRSGPAALAHAAIDRILPGFTATVTTPDGSQATRSGLISQPQDILQPASGEDANLISVVVLDTRGPNPGPVGSASLFGSYASTLHVTPDTLYIFSPQWDDRGDATTRIAQFALGGTSPSLVATGSVPGTLLDQYSADATGGYLRVATTAWDSESADNGLYVLQQQGNRLNIVGMVDQLAPGESLDAARFEGDRAFLVTFHQVDPLWSIDLTNPTAPKVAGQLTLPGYSEFLQPIGTDDLLGVGREVNPGTGETTDLKLSLFDVHDLSRPVLIASQTIAPDGAQWTWSDAEWDPHALGWFPELNVLAIPVQGWGPVQQVAPGTDPATPEWQSLSALYVFRIDTGAGSQAFQALGTVDHTSLVVRSVRINDVLYSIADEDVQSVRVIDSGLTPLGQATIQTDTSGWPGGPVLGVALAPPAR